MKDTKASEICPATCRQLKLMAFHFDLLMSRFNAIFSEFKLLLG